MLKLNSNDAGFADAFNTLVEARRDTDEDISRDVAFILSRVRSEGDAAVAELTAKFDGHSLPWRIDPAECKAAFDALDGELRSALELAHKRITDYHVRQRPADSAWTDAVGVTMGARWGAVEAAGLYVPGGRFNAPRLGSRNTIRGLQRYIGDASVSKLRELQA